MRFIGLDGRFSSMGVIVLHAAFGLFMGFAPKLIWWARTDGAPAPDFALYAVLFSVYHATVSLLTHVVILRRAEGHAWRMVFGVLLAWTVFIALRWLGDQWLLPLLDLPSNYPPGTTLVSFALDNVTYALPAIAYGALMYLLERQFVQQHERAERAYSERLSELDMLRARMSPHFLFNTLNGLYALAERRDGTLGPAMLDLAELMRYHAKQQAAEVTIADELEQVERFVALQRLRYERPLQLIIDVPAEVRQAMVPAMTLLPIMENVFKHGDPCDAARPVRLKVERIANTVHVTCTNPIGAHVHTDAPGTGCHNLARRLELLHGRAAHARFRPTDNGSFKAELSIPFTV